MNSNLRQQAMRYRLQGTSNKDSDWDAVNSLVAEYGSLLEEKQLDFKTAVARLAKALVQLT